MDILPPSQNPSLIGHDEALTQIGRDFASGRMAHAWMLCGIGGIGKATLAYHMAHAALSNFENKLGQINMAHPQSRLVAAGAHPDLFVLQRPTDEKTGAVKDVIPAEEARKIAPFLRMTSTHGGWRVALVDEAHALNRFGQNALLKVIEEPPKRCLIVLTVTTPGALLPTIRSRCRVIKLQPLTDQALRLVLMRSGVDQPEDEMARLVALSGGSVGLALRLMETEGVDLFDELMRLVKDLPALDVPKLHAYADKITRKGESEKTRVLTELLTTHLARDARERARQGLPLDRSLHLWDKVREVFTQSGTSALDPKLAFVNAVVEMRNLCR